MAIIEYDRRPDATIDEKLTSLVESVMRALDEIDGHTVATSSDSESIGKGRSEISPEDGAFKIYDASGTVIASFGEQAQVGVGTESHSVIDANGQRFYATDGTTLLANIGYGEGNTEDGTAKNPYYTFGTRKAATSIYSASTAYKLGDMVLYPDEYGEAYVCKEECTGIAPSSINPGLRHWELAHGDRSFASGRDVIASGSQSHAEGVGTVAVGGPAHAEGWVTKAIGSSHAEGNHTVASGAASHAEGYYSEATGPYSHAGGYDTKAPYNFLTAIGKLNDPQLGDLFEIGNGNSSGRRNVFSVDENGNVVAKGTITASTLYRELALGDDFTLYDGSDEGALVFRRFGNVCTISGIVTPNGTIPGGITRKKICHIPDGSWPSSDIHVVAQGSGNAEWTCSVLASTGNVAFSRYRNTASAANTYIDVSNGQWLPFHVAWIVQ